MDVESIGPGEKLAAINTAVKSCDVLLALIGKEWLTVKEADGNRRIDNPRTGCAGKSRPPWRTTSPSFLS